MTVLKKCVLPLLILLNIVSCNPIETEGQSDNLLFEVKEISCTDSRISISARSITSAQVFREDSLIFIFSGSGIDTTLIDYQLKPNTSYNYKLLITGPDYKTASREIILRTMDTTSHSFTWQSFTFGQHSSSMLYDVAIINENNIWAVGEIYMKDSLGNNDHQSYNVAHWDGNAWKLKRIYYYGMCSAVTYPPLKTIQAFSDDSIVVTNGGSIGWLNGSIVKLDCRVNPLLTGAINKLWGTSYNNLYAVGERGNIAYYNGIGWQMIESGTTTRINDIWGYSDPITSIQKIYCAVTLVFNPGDRKILTISNNQVVDSIPWDKSKRVNSIWTDNIYNLYAVGDGIFENKSGRWREVNKTLMYYSNRVRGTAQNNIFVCGDYGSLAHFNGSTWHNYYELYMNGSYKSIAVTNDMVIAVGYKNSGAMITVGRRK